MAVFKSKLVDNRGLAAQGLTVGAVGTLSSTVTARRFPDMSRWNTLHKRKHLAKLLANKFYEMMPAPEPPELDLYSYYRYYREMMRGNASTALHMAKHRARLEIADKLTQDKLCTNLTTIRRLLEERVHYLTFTYGGVEIHVKAEVDDDTRQMDDCVTGFELESGAHIDTAEVGWGREGMDLGLYTFVDRVNRGGGMLRANFNETRQDLIKWAPKGMSKSCVYQWATEEMRRKAEDAVAMHEREIEHIGIIVSTDHDDNLASLWGIEVPPEHITPNFDTLSYVLGVVDDLCHEAMDQLRMTTD